MVDVASGRKRRIVLTGIFDRVFDSNNVIAYIQVHSGAIKAREFGKPDDEPTHYTSDGLWTGGAKTFLMGTVLGGRIDRIVSTDASTYLVCFYGN